MSVSRRRFFEMAASVVTALGVDPKLLIRKEPVLGWSILENPLVLRAHWDRTYRINLKWLGRSWGWYLPHSNHVDKWEDP